MSIATTPTARGRRSSLLSRLRPRLLETLTTPHAVDRYLELVDPMMTVDDMRAEVVAVRHQTADTVTLTLRPTWQWKGFSAGHFVQIGVVVDGVRHTRCYSPAGTAGTDDDTIELTVKAQPDGIVSNYLVASAKPGLVVNLAPATGTFELPSPRPDHVLLISGGSGITPVMSMLRTLVHEGYTGRVAFLHYAYTENDVCYRAELDRIAAENDNVDVLYAYTDQQNGGHLHGFFDTEHLNVAAPWHASAQTFLCGPPGLMKGVRSVFDELGLSESLFSEEFVTAVPVVDGDASGTVSFSGSSVEAENDGATLLEQAENAGLTPEFGCRMGICFTCTAIKKSGCTRNVKTGELDSDPDNEIQLCISVPVGDVDIDV
ncbi:ferredoxin reductase [Rhodococcus sp. BP-149]|uniref:ferredoxin reductase n=1 Tax=unclassified Rhodococcus (in: high G+C Gram-positive bacteria) TaxID=192944 RepID=UPI001C9B7963|nr:MULTISPECIES: ferredoxin reductase [unclassified Rhodococcus (in: high G+C Gram-positive bacteria)]MBY6686274.1 ferredoxin reductase [Rhodococcus sp. BP-288]MBY6693637.1 ferredoxin reductase [Rhodococcus sp. BP-188]MBY6699766.1 ferredoxin reductase [Rhodococcus sp. BP-285]MBY6703889.1 ferredoxin reductase [Rhodococcus sp. BP-283]MBY6710963.1 ferredoxin reductase [Rhodococcus sp. BP-160]